MSTHDESIIETGNVRVRIMKLGPGEMTQWHSHTEVTDTFFCLSGRIVIRTRESEATLAPGETWTVPPGRVHRVENPTLGISRYLLVQGVGRYDFIPAPAGGLPDEGVR